MTALTSDRNTPRLEGDLRVGKLAAGQLVFAGGFLMRNANGFLVKGQTGLGLVGVGRAETRVDNSAGADGDKDQPYRIGGYRYANSSGADEITAAHIGQAAFAVDDQTVAATDGGGTRSPAAIIDGVDEHGVWLRFDEALTKAI